MQQESRNSGASSSLSANSPSFTSYSSENIADIAARVVHELNLSQNDDLYDDFYSSIPQNDAVEAENNAEADNDDVESEFEFAILGEDTSSPISADEIFYNGQIKPSYPLFDTNLLFYTNQHDVVSQGRQSTPSPSPLRLPLRSLMREERERGNDSVSTSSSSEDAAELEGVPPETYCVWVPPKKEVDHDDVATMKKKSNSTGSGAGSSKRWRLKNLLPRSHSDGKDTFVFLTPNNGKEMKKRNNIPTPTVNNNEYSKNGYGGGQKMGEVKKKSYLPYRQDLVGLFSNVNGLSRSISPF